MKPASALPLVIAFLAVACSSSDDGATTASSGAGGTSSSGASVSSGSGAGGSGEGGAGGAAAPGLATHCGPDAVEFVTSAPGTARVTTAHYTLTAETDAATAEDFAKLLEASWGGFVDYFGTAPDLAEDERLDVRYFATSEAWATAIAADGGAVPQNAGGLFLPSTRRAYLYDQHNPYFNQTLLVHEAAHQFHLLGRAKGRTLPFWYVEGIAEYLGRHDWDGRCAKLGTVPLMNWDDLPAVALQDAVDGGIDVATLTSGMGSPTRAAAWSLVRFLELGATPTQHDGFTAFRAAFDAGSSSPSDTFATLVGESSELGADLGAWIPSSQQPMRPIYTEWLHRGPDSVLAWSPGVFSLSVMKSKATHLEATYELPEAATWKVGVVLGFNDPQNFKAIVIGHDGKLSSFTATNGQAFWNAAGVAPAKLNATHGTLAIDLVEGSKAALSVNGATSTHETVFAPTLGLALDDTRVLFRDIAWN